MTVHLTIDGISVEVPDGTTVLRAAEQAGITIPTLCDHKHLSPFGGCRLCIVEVDGFRVPVASCTLPASNNMVVRTNTDKLRASRQFILSMLFSERNHFCPFCQLSGGDCELQNAAYAEGMTHWPIQPNWNTFKVDTSHPFFVLDNNRCILCRRCVRACAEITGNFTLNIAERGSNSLLVADCDLPLGQSSCIQCGNCVQACPTGALIDRQSAYKGLEKRLQKVESTCVGCSVGCGVNVLIADGNVVRVEGAWDHSLNGGAMCKTGRFEPMAENRPRIKSPMIRKNGKLEPVSWDEALQEIASKLKPLADKSGSGVAAIASTRIPVEDLALFKELFGGGLKSDMVTSLEEGWPTVNQSALAAELGQPFESNLEALRTADCVLVFGADLAEHHQVAGFFIKRALPKGTRLILVGRDANGMDDLASYNLRAASGEDIEIIRAMQAAVAKAGLSKAPISMDTDGVLASAAASTGVDAAEIAGAAQLLASASNPVIVFGKNINGNALQALKALLDLGKMTGAGLLSVKGKANSLAAAQLGLEQNFQLNGHQAAYVLAADDGISKRMMQRLEKAPFLVAQAAVASPLTEKADVVLPVTHWAEQEGHFINLEGRVQLARQAVAAPKEVWSNSQVLKALAGKLNLTLSGDWKTQIRQRVSPVAIVE
jgi:formate dehydrogenase major subunit